MSIFGRYNYKDGITLIKGIPIRDMSDPILVHVITEVCRSRIFFIDLGWSERLQETYVLHVHENTVLIRAWDTTDYESLNFDVHGPVKMWGKMINLEDIDKGGGALNWYLSKHFAMKMTPGLSVRTMIDRMKRMPLYARLKFSEKIVKNRAVKISKILARAAR
jgi:hypothetical protein